MDATKSNGFLNGFTLKIIAMISMFIDHFTAVFINSEQYTLLYEVLRGIGRLAFPIFCFLLVEGFIHTGNVKRYLMRLFVFAILSEIPFDLAFAASPGLYYNHQNVFFTLVLGLLTLCCIEQFKNDAYMNIITIIIACLVAYILRFDYSYYGIIQIMIFYFLRNSSMYKLFCIGFLNIIMRQPVGALALIFTENYNGKRGPGVKYLMYIFYPAHLMLLFLVKYYMVRRGIN